MSEFVNTIDKFGDVETLRSIVGKTITEYNDDKITSIGNNTFSACKKLICVDLSECTKIGQSSFESCSLLTTINIPKLKELSAYVFNACTNLIKIDLPNTLSIKASSFSGCTNLKAVILRGSNLYSLDSTDAFQNTPIVKGTGYVYVPRALLNSYKTATNWSTFADQFRALEDYTVDGTTTGELDESKI